jgi:hypothetical protein
VQQARQVGFFRLRVRHAAGTAAVSELFQKARRSALPELGKLLKVWKTDSLITSVLIMSVPSVASDCSRPTLRPDRW